MTCGTLASWSQEMKAAKAEAQVFAKD